MLSYGRSYITTICFKLFSGKYYGMDDDGYKHAVTHECLELSGHVMPEGGVYNSQGMKDPYIRHMGQLTVYRWGLANS